MFLIWPKETQGEYKKNQQDVVSALHRSCVVAVGNLLTIVPNLHDLRNCFILGDQSEDTNLNNHNKNEIK